MDWSIKNLNRPNLRNDNPFEDELGSVLFFWLWIDPIIRAHFAHHFLNQILRKKHCNRLPSFVLKICECQKNVDQRLESLAFPGGCSSDLVIFKETIAAKSTNDVGLLAHQVKEIRSRRWLLVVSVCQKGFIGGMVLLFHRC